MASYRSRRLANIRFRQPVVKKLVKATGAENYNVLQNNGRIAHQQVDHVHFHVIPKPSPQKGLILSESPDIWPRVEASKEELAETLKKMQSRL